MHFNSSGTSALTSPQLPWRSSYSGIRFCLEFQYKMPSNTTSSLKVRVLRTYQYPRIEWSVTGYHGNDWQQASVSFDSVKAYTVCYCPNDTIPLLILTAKQELS